MIRYLRGSRKLRKAGLASVACAAAAVVLTGCVLGEGKQYQVNDAPPNGVYVNIYTVPTDLIQSVVYGQICHGSISCTMDQLKTFQFKRNIFGYAMDYIWDLSLRSGEQGDFAEALANAFGTDGGAQRCLNLTIRAYEAYPPGWDYNWTWRPLSDGNCTTGSV